MTICVDNLELIYAFNDYLCRHFKTYLSIREMLNKNSELIKQQ